MSSQLEWFVLTKSSFKTDCCLYWRGVVCTAPLVLAIPELALSHMLWTEHPNIARQQVKARSAALQIALFSISKITFTGNLSRQVLLVGAVYKGRVSVDKVDVLPLQGVFHFYCQIPCWCRIRGLLLRVYSFSPWLVFPKSIHRHLSPGDWPSSPTFRQLAISVRFMARLMFFMLVKLLMTSLGRVCDTC